MDPSNFILYVIKMEFKINSDLADCQMIAKISYLLLVVYKFHTARTIP